jgi:uncharacterized phage protein gp47/JayE
MTFTIKTADELITELKINLVNNVEEINDLNVGSVIDVMLTTIGNSLEGLYNELNDVYNASRISTATGDDLEELSQLVGVERNLGVKSTGKVTFKTNTPLTSEMIITKDSKVSTQPNTTEEQLLFNVLEDTTFLTTIPYEEHYYLSGTYDYALNQRFIDSITSLSDGVSTFEEGVDFDIIPPDSLTYPDFIVSTDDSLMFDDCESTATWSAEEIDTSITLDNSIFYEGAASIGFVKTSIVLSTFAYVCDLGSTIDIEDKSCIFDLYIHDEPTLNKIVKIIFSYSSDSSFINSVEKEITNFSTGWQTLFITQGEVGTTSKGNMDIGNQRYFKVDIELNDNSSVLSTTGLINIDNIRFSSKQDYYGDIIRFNKDSINLPTTETNFYASYIPLSVEVNCESSDIGDKYNVSANKINYKVSNFSLIKEVNNYEAFTDGVDEETDDSLRERAAEATELTNVATIEAIRNNVLALPYVQTCTIIDMPTRDTFHEAHVFATASPKYRLNYLVPNDNPNLIVYTNFSNLSAGIDKNDTTISVDDGSVFDVLGGTIRIDDEFITYTGVSTNDLTGCVRGALSSEAVSHNIDALVMSADDYERGVDFILNNYFEIEFLGVNDPANGTVLYNTYDYDAAGFFDVYVTGTSGQLTSTQITAIEEVVDSVRSGGIVAMVYQPTYEPISIVAVLTLDSDYVLSDVEDEIEANVEAYVNGLGLGEDVVRFKVISEIMKVEGVSNITSLSISGNTTTDYPISDDEKASFSSISLS